MLRYWEIFLHIFSPWYWMHVSLPGAWSLGDLAEKWGISVCCQWGSSPPQPVMSSVKSNIFNMDLLRLLSSSCCVFCEESCQGWVKPGSRCRPDLNTKSIWVSVSMLHTEYMDAFSWFFFSVFSVSESAYIAFRELCIQYVMWVAVCNISQSQFLCTMSFTRQTLDKNGHLGWICRNLQ